MMNEKRDRLKGVLEKLERVLVAYSGGVDSTLLLKMAKDTLGKNNVLAVTALSPLYPDRELKGAETLARSIGVRHVLITSNELEVEGFSNNPPDRCYLCKKELFKKLSDIAKGEMIPFVIEGSTLDDEKDHRPGRRAVRELGVRSPLQEARLTKSDVRELSKIFDLPTWDKPSFACLASRFPYGDEITMEALARVDRAETYLLSLGFRQVRVRNYRNLARIELYPEEITRLVNGSMRDEVVRHLKEIGYQYVTLDLQGFRSGSMNEVLG